MVFNLLGCRTFLPLYRFSLDIKQYVFSEKRKREEGVGREEEEGIEEGEGEGEKGKRRCSDETEVEAPSSHQLSPLPQPEASPRNPRV